MESTIKFKRSRGKANLRKRIPAISTTSSSDSDDSSSQDDTKPRGTHVERLKTNPSAQGSTTTSSQDLCPTLFTADGAVPISNNNYAANSARAVGPVKRPTNVRTTVTTDFSPDVCKDYKQTGFCGFGDNCKFVHIREDYKQGWQRDREWEDVTKGKKKVSGTVVASINGKDAKEEEGGDEETFLESISFTCIICKASYKEPIVTRCGHYFCQPCALKQYRKDPTCAVCGADTNGVFNSAKRLEKLLEKKRERAAKRSPAGTENRDEVSDEDEGQL
ncbi:Pre-mRNA-splicing factor cwc24 [Fusarium duplospermum]|uniref:Pre-mRNA-splicing factor CWC24 n=1 Tax=Fusarium duplospermum TaxID=1325734 RepID=A0A428PVA4_9HYPO|nr:Pre-mRNA-splicing factor cwc24 [Fusarium duplospermum]